MKMLLYVLLLIGCFEYGTAQYYPYSVGPSFNQNTTFAPYPYQTALGMNPNPDTTNSQSPGIPSSGFPGPYPYPTGYGMPNSNMDGYYALLAQQGRPAYPYPGMGYPGYPYAPQGFGYPQYGYGYPQFGPGYPGGFGQPGVGYPQQPSKGVGQPTLGSNANIKTEIIDVSPEYQRKLLGWPAESVGSSASGQNGNCVGSQCQDSFPNRPRYTVNIDTQTSNDTVIPVNLTKPIVTEKRFVTSIRRTFVYDSSKPETIKPINVHIVNGQQVTTTAPPETTVSEDVEENSNGSTVKPSGRRFMDVPKSCAQGSLLAQNGQCIAPFTLRNHLQTDQQHPEIVEEFKR